MSSTEMNKALVLYKNFCSFTDTLKKEANTVPMLFGFSFKEPNYYKPDSRKEKAMKNALRDKESGGDGFAYDDEFADDMLSKKNFSHKKFSLKNLFFPSSEEKEGFYSNILLIY